MGRGRLLYLSLHCHHQNDSCIKVGSDESHFNVSLIVRDKVTRQCPQTTILKVKGEPKQIRKPRSLCLPAYRLTARPNRLTDKQVTTAKPVYRRRGGWRGAGGCGGCGGGCAYINAPAKVNMLLYVNRSETVY